MAEVFRARHLRLGRIVALKILAPHLATDDMFRQRFLRESRIAASMNHQHIVPVFDADDDQGVLYIAMMLAAGGDVASLVQADGPLPAEQAAEIISQAAQGLDAAHREGLVHRDVKPNNMLLGARPVAGHRDHVYLSDFGLSKDIRKDTGVTTSGQQLGTPAYMSPEQIDAGPVDGRADQYSLACSAFVLLTGDPPFVRSNDFAILNAHKTDSPPRLAKVGSTFTGAVDEVFTRALAKIPENRFSSCQEFADALTAALREPVAALTVIRDKEAAPEPRPSDPERYIQDFLPPSAVSSPAAVGDPHPIDSPEGKEAPGGLLVAPAAVDIAAPSDESSVESADSDNLAVGLGDDGLPVSDSGGSAGSGDGSGRAVGPARERRFSRWQVIGGGLGLVVVAVVLVVVLRSCIAPAPSQQRNNNSSGSSHRSSPTTRVGSPSASTSQGTTAPAVSVLTISVPAHRIHAGQSITAHIAGRLPNGQNAPAATLAGVRWESRDREIAIVRHGTITGVRPGRVKITATLDGHRATVQMVVLRSLGSTTPGGTVPANSPTRSTPPPTTPAKHSSSTPTQTATQFNGEPADQPTPAPQPSPDVEPTPTDAMVGVLADTLAGAEPMHSDFMTWSGEIPVSTRSALLGKVRGTVDR